MHQKLALDPFLILLNYPKQPLHSRKKWDILKKDYQKAFEKLTLFFLSNPVPFNGKSYQKQNVSGTSAQSLSRSRNKFTKIPLFVIYYLTKFDDVMFWVIPKIISANLCRSIHDIINYPTSTCPFRSGKCGKEGKKKKK